MCGLTNYFHFLGITPNSCIEAANPFKFDAAFNSTKNFLKDLPDNIAEASIKYSYQTVSADNINIINDELKAKREQSNLVREIFFNNHLFINILLYFYNYYYYYYNVKSN